MAAKDPFKTSRRRPFRRLARWALRALLALFKLVLVFAAAGAVIVAGLYVYVVREHEGSLDRRYPDLAQNSAVYDAVGDKIGEFPAEQSRETVGPGGLGEHLPRAVVAVEDRRFYQHPGVDFEGLSRAAWRDLRAWEVQEGGSTITEQLMKNLYVPEEEWSEVSFRRRFERSSLAFAYERRHKKEEILTSYLNTAYFGDGAYGAEVAAESYFGESARNLGLSEAATLAGFLHAPSTYLSDSGSTRRATERRDLVLALMQEQGMISAAERRRAAAKPVEFALEPPPDDGAYEPFMDKVYREVEEQLGSGALERGGLEIHTTLDPGMQREAVASTKETLYLPNDPSAAVVTVEPQSGAIRSLAGQRNGFNLALDARRQPGSSFKPFVLAAALKEYVSPRTTYVSRDLTVRLEDGRYEVGNYGMIERGQITVSEAMAESDNTVFVQLALDLGMGNVVRTARDLGITTPMEPYPPTAIGGLGIGVSPLDMASAYATFAAGGVYREPYSIERMERSDFGRHETVYEHRLAGRRVMSGNQAALATEVLRGVVEHGTASRFHDLDREVGLPSAGKTGTTDEFADAWYVGYTPRLSTAVWVGHPEGRKPMVGVHGLEEVNGETLPLDLWSLYMSRVTAGEPPLGFPEADESEFEVWERGYAVDGRTAGFTTPAPPITSASVLGDRVRGIVDGALREASAGRGLPAAVAGPDGIKPLWTWRDSTADRS